MDKGEEIYQYIVNNDIIQKDYFEDFVDKNKNLEHLFHSFLNDSILSDEPKMKILKTINKGEEKKRTIYEYFDLVQTKFNIMFYDMQI